MWASIVVSFRMRLGIHFRYFLKNPIGILFGIPFFSTCYPKRFRKCSQTKISGSIQKILFLNTCDSYRGKTHKCNFKVALKVVLHTCESCLAKTYKCADQKETHRRKALDSESSEALFWTSFG